MSDCSDTSATESEGSDESGSGSSEKPTTISLEAAEEGTSGSGTYLSYVHITIAYDSDYVITQATYTATLTDVAGVATVDTTFMPETSSDTDDSNAPGYLNGEPVLDEKNQTLSLEISGKLYPILFNMRRRINGVSEATLTSDYVSKFATGYIITTGNSGSEEASSEEETPAGDDTTTDTGSSNSNSDETASEEDYGEYVTKVRTVEDDSGNTPIGIKFTFLVVCLFSFFLSLTHSLTHILLFSLAFQAKAGPSSDPQQYIVDVTKSYVCMNQTQLNYYSKSATAGISFCEIEFSLLESQQLSEKVLGSPTPFRLPSDFMEPLRHPPPRSDTSQTSMAAMMLVLAAVSVVAVLA